MLTHRQLFPLDRVMPLQATLAGDLQPGQLQVMQAHARQTFHDLFCDKNPDRFEIPFNPGLSVKTRGSQLDLLVFKQAPHQLCTRIELFRLGMPVTRLLIERLPTTFELSLAALVVSMIFGIPLGIISAVKHNSWLDVVTMIWANIGVSMPVFWLGLMLAYVFSLLLKDTPFWLPPSGRVSPGIPDDTFYELWGWVVPETGLWSAFLNFTGRLNILNSLLTQNWELLKDSIKHLILPALALGTIPMAIIARMSRSAMLDVLGQDYIRTARAKGLRWSSVIIKHAFRNSLLPVVTVIGLSFGGLLGGAVLTETIFGLSGVGRTLYEAITARDYGIVQAFTLAIAVVFVVVNLLVDISYAYLDPRIRLN